MQSMDTTSPDPYAGEAPCPKALEKAAGAVQQAAATEETRFNNLNTRAVSLISAGSIVIALIAVFVPLSFLPGQTGHHGIRHQENLQGHRLLLRIGQHQRQPHSRQEALFAIRAGIDDEKEAFHGCHPQ